MIVVLLLLHYLGLGGMIAITILLKMYDLAIVNGVVFLMLSGLEVALCKRRAKVYQTVPVKSEAATAIGVVMQPVQ